MTANKIAFYVLFAAGVLIGLYFADVIIQWIAENFLSVVTLGAVGGGAAEAARRKKNKAKQEAEIYDDMRVSLDPEIVKLLDEYEKQGKENQDTADEITKPDNSINPNLTRKRWDID